MVSESPAVARRRLRLALRKLREAKGVTQGQVAETLEWSLSKVNRIESGDVTISNTDLRALLDFLGVEDKSTIERLTDEARASRRKGWWDEARYREHLNQATLQLLQFEGEASAIRSFQPALIPGVLQTRAYAEAVFAYWDEMVKPPDRETRIEVRMHRASQVLDRPDPPQYLVILGEIVLLRQVGGPGVLTEQLNRLLVATEAPTTQVRILPLAHAAGAMSSAFSIFDLGEEENAVLYRETDTGDAIEHAADRVQYHRRTFESFWDSSFNATKSKELIRAAIRQMVTFEE